MIAITCSKCCYTQNDITICIESEDLVTIILEKGKCLVECCCDCYCNYCCNECDECDECYFYLDY